MGYFQVFVYCYCLETKDLRPMGRRAMISSHACSATQEHTCMKAVLYLDKPLQLEEQSHNFYGELSTLDHSIIMLLYRIVPQSRAVSVR